MANNHEGMAAAIGSVASVRFERCTPGPAVTPSPQTRTSQNLPKTVVPRHDGGPWAASGQHCWQWSSAVSLRLDAAGQRREPQFLRQWVSAVHKWWNPCQRHGSTHKCQREPPQQRSGRAPQQRHRCMLAMAWTVQHR